jgi:hypothetical protein
MKTGLELLREPFPANQISKLPKGTKAQNECKYEEKVKCAICGGFHHPKVIHLDYVGHAALTDRLLNADISWTWEPLAYKDGLPAFDDLGGLWIKLTVLGTTRLGYGNAEKSNFKSVGDREKEVIGDALRNAAMRFGCALDLWHKGDLHAIEEKDEPKPTSSEKKPIPEDVPIEPGKSLAEKAFERMTAELQVETLKEMATKKNHEPKKPIEGFSEKDRKAYFNFLTSYEVK